MVLRVVESGALAENRAVLDALSAGADVMAEMVAAIGRGEGDGAVDADGVIEELGQWAPGRQEDAALSAAAAPSSAAPVGEAAPAAAVVLEASSDPRLLAAFLEDAEDRSQRLASLLAALEPGAAVGDAIHETFRAAHDLKSASATAGYHRMSRLAHRMEDVLHKARDGTLEITEPVRDALLAGSDRIAEMVAAIGSGEAEATVDTTAAIAALSAFAPAAARPAPRPRESRRRARPAVTEQSLRRLRARAGPGGGRPRGVPLPPDLRAWTPRSRCGSPGRTFCTRGSRTP